jgi:transcription antitermination factor NusG
MDMSTVTGEQLPVEDRKDFRNWYVLYTYSGLEEKIKSSIEKLFGDRYELYLPRRELFHTINGEHRKIVRALFPGYLFIHKKIDEFILDIRKHGICRHLSAVRQNFVPAMVCENEMEFLMKISGPDGLVTISEGILKQNRSVEIVSGPLKNLTGRILFINARKRKAKIRVRMLNREVQLTLGLEVLNHSGGQNEGKQRMV